MDVKANSELQIDEFISKYTSKLSALEDTVQQLTSKSHTFESSYQDLQTQLSRLKTHIKDVQRDKDLSRRVDLLETRLSDSQIDIMLKDRLKHLNADTDTLMSQMRGVKEHLQSFEQGMAKRMDDFKRRVEQAVTQANNKIKSEFTFK